MATGRWCFRPRPRPHELLSSWLHRLALANATRDHTMCKTMWPGAEVWARDLDRSLPPLLMPVLSMWTGVSETALSRMQLTRWMGYLAEDIPPNGHAPWILPLGIYHRIRRRPGLLFCPACLSEDDADAVWMWRLAWTVSCRRHRLDLFDACPHCNTPYMPHRSAPSLLGRMPCTGCGRDLAKLQQQPSPVWAWQFQQRMETALLEGRTQIAGRGYFALPFFAGLRSLASRLLTGTGAELAMRSVARPCPAVLRTGHLVEWQPYDRRRWVLEACWTLLQDWPTTFLEAARRVGHRHHAVDRVPQEDVFWLKEGLDKLEGCRQRQVTEPEACAIADWLRSQGAAVTWNAVLHVAGISTPTRLPQPAVRALLENRNHALKGIACAGTAIDVELAAQPGL